MENVEPVIFDYNEIDEEANRLTVRPFSGQVDILKKVLEKVKMDNPGAVIDMVCHSQGAIIAALARPAGIRKVIFLAPPFNNNLDRMIAGFRSRPETKIDFQGVSRLARSDGSITIVPPEYWAEKEKINVPDLYDELSKQTELIIINANQDGILENGDSLDLRNVEILNIDGDHNFTGKNRERLLEIVAEKINV